MDQKTFMDTFTQGTSFLNFYPKSSRKGCRINHNFQYEVHIVKYAWGSLPEQVFSPPRIKWDHNGLQVLWRKKINGKEHKGGRESHRNRS